MQKGLFKMRSAFTLIEMVFVIVIIGIIGSLGTDIVANAYKNYIFSLVQNRLESRSSAALNFMAKKLEFRIRESTIARNSSDNSFVLIADYTDEDMIEWDDSFYESKIDGNPTSPIFVPLVDLQDASTTASQLYFPVLDTSAVNTLIDSLSNKKHSLDDAAIIFRGANTDKDSYAWDYNAITDQSKSIHPIKTGAIANTLQPSTEDDFTGYDVWEFADIIWTARAIKYDSANKTLTYYDNYQPWNGKAYTNANTKVLIAENVSDFQLSVLGEVIQLHLCIEDPNLSSEFGGGYAICKDQTVF